MQEFQIQWTVGNQWGIVYIEARTEASAHSQARKQIPFSATARRFASIQTV